MTDELIEIMATALHESNSEQDIRGYLNADIDCNILANAALQAIQSLGTFMVVPVEPTGETSR